VFAANPIFDESFEFHINLPELALVRFAVLDDDFIGDEFIGQYTIPFACMQPGDAFMLHLLEIGCLYFTGSCIHSPHPFWCRLPTLTLLTILIPPNPNRNSKMTETPLHS